jgi:hypothetical protein
MWKTTHTSHNTVAIGAHALRANAGDGNTAIGSNAGRQVTSGHDNVFLGRNSGRRRSQKRNAVNTVAIGANTITTEDNQVVIGNDETQTIVLAGVKISKAQLQALIGMLGERDQNPK